MQITAEGIAAVFARLQDGYARLDAAALSENYAEDCVVESLIAGRLVGPVAVERTLRIFFSAFPDLRMNTEELLVFGNRAVWTVAMKGTDNGGFMGLPPTGKQFITPLIALYTFDSDHKIVHERRMYDLSRLLLHLSGENEPATEGPRLYRELLDKAQREHELKIAAEIQRALLPHSRHEGSHFQVAATSVPCRAIGGDFFDYFTLPSGAFSFVLGDVAGKGPPAALLASMLQGIFTANANRGDRPAIAIHQANDALMRRAIEARFATIVYGALSCDGTLTYCNAGHNPPLLVGKHGTLRLETGGMVVGAFEQAIFDEQTLQLEPGDLLVAYSDGVTEARNAESDEFGEERLLACVRANCDLAPTELLQCVFDAVHQFSAGTAQGDDLTLLVLRFAGG
jgi:steroid delta-isomerase-like uncharacterized protein